MKSTASAACLLLATLSSATVFHRWERQYHILPYIEQFRHTAVDPAGNVYAIGSAFNGENNDVICVKYGYGGGLHWARRIGGMTLFEEGKFVALSADGSEVYIAYDRGNACSVARLNPATGTSMWTQNFNPPPGTDSYTAEGLYVDQQAPTHLIYVPLEVKWTGGGTAIAGYNIAPWGALWSGVFHAVGDSSQKILDFAGRPGGGIYYLTGRDFPTPSAGAIHVYSTTGYVATVAAPTAQAIAYSDVGGGYFFAAGIDGAGVKLWRFRSSTNTLSMVATDNLAPIGANSVWINDLAADSDGNVYPAGWYDVVDLNHQWLLARYNHPSFARQWIAAVLPTSIVNDEFHRVAIDPGRNLVVSRSDMHPALSTGDIGAHVYNGVNGALLGSFVKSGVDHMSALIPVAANARGDYSLAGYLTEGGEKRGLVWLLSQDGLKMCWTTAPAYVAGATVPIHISMYASTAAARTVSLATSSPYVPVPPTVSVPAVQTEVTVYSASLRSAIDRNVVITASFAGVARQATFLLKAPRPVVVACTPNPVTGGSPATGRVTMNGIAPEGGLIVNLWSSNRAVATMDPNVTVPGGAGAANFPIATSTVTSSTPVTIAASYLGTAASATLTVNP